MSAVKVVTTDSWSQDVTQAPGLVLVDLWAPWCGPCKALAPSFAELAEDYAGELTLAKLNVDENKPISDALKVRGIPLLVMFKDGQEVGRITGGSKSALATFIDSHLA